MELQYNRSPIEVVQFIRSMDVIPPLYFCTTSIFSLLNDLSSTDTTIQRRTTAMSFSEKESNDQTLKSVIGFHTSVLKVDKNIDDDMDGNTELSLSIPISPRPLTDSKLIFQKDATM